MMKYKISYKDPHKHIITVEIQAEGIDSEYTYVQIPAWRPGRYELQNYAQNIQRFQAVGPDGSLLASSKINRNRWKVPTNGINSFTVTYTCYCYQMDAGGAWLDEEQLYLNLIFCCFFIIGKEKEECQLILDIPADYKVATGLPYNGSHYVAKNYLQLMDSPLIASSKLISREYEIAGTRFHIWIEGDVSPEWDKIVTDFKKFTKESINLFGEFPERDYHFLFEIVYYKNYHGVEHSNSTIIVLGPAENFNNQDFYENFLGISCHELFHAWNALKIRPKEMMPYDLTQENYFKTGYVIEGLTTYYGDYLLARSGVFSTEQYFKELDLQLEKYFDNFGRHNLSVSDSSHDLWIDGYSPGIPHRKVSIYTSGALAGLLLDLLIRKESDNKKCLDDVMRIMWKEYGKATIGYSEADYKRIVEDVIEKPMDDYFSDYIHGIKSIECDLNEALKFVGCHLVEVPSEKINERKFGLRYVKRSNKIIIKLIEPGSPADKYLSADDQILAINNLALDETQENLFPETDKISLTILRFGKIIIREIESDRKTYFNKYRIEKIAQANGEAKSNFYQWLNMTH